MGSLSIRRFGGGFGGFGDEDQHAPTMRHEIDLERETIVINRCPISNSTVLEKLMVSHG